VIVAQVVGAESVVSKFQTLPPQIHAKVKDRMQRLVMTLLTKVKEEKLNGQVLRNLSGTLYRSINQRVDDQGSSITGSVGTNLVYARAHEFGVDQEVQIREHLRTVTMAWGRELKEPVICIVSAHQAHMHLPERSFLRSALEDMRPQVREQLLQAMRESGL
jgi:phage gpG-like protein